MVKLELSTTDCTFLFMVLGMICTLVIDENFEKGLFFVLSMTQKPYFSWNEYNTKIFVARRAPWQKATLTSLGFVRSAKTNFRWNFPLQQIFELIHSALCTWAVAWKFSLSANKREIVPKHYSLPLPDPATSSERLVGEVTQYANWLKGKGAWSSPTVPLKKSVRLAFKRDEELFPDELQRTLLFSQVATTTLGHWSKETRISLPFEGKE